MGEHTMKCSHCCVWKDKGDILGKWGKSGEEAIQKYQQMKIGSLANSWVTVYAEISLQIQPDNCLAFLFSL